MKNKYKIITRDWKGSYSEGEMEACKGWLLVGGEEQIEDGNDVFVLVFSKKPTKMMAHEIYEISNRMYDEVVEGFEVDESDHDIIIEK